MNRNIIFLLLVALACNEPKQEQPNYLLTEEKMVKLMVDMHIVETAQNLKLMGVDSTNRRYQQYFNSIFESHNVSKTAFDSSLHFYSTKTDKMNQIYDKVLEELHEIESAVKSNK